MSDSMRPRPHSRLVSGDVFWSATYRMRLFLVFIVLATFVMLPIDWRGPGGKALPELVVALALITELPRAVHDKRVVLLSGGLVAATISARWLGVLRPGWATDSLASLLTAMTLVLVAGVILIDVFGPGPVNVDRIFGAVPHTS
jgi:hypothetical protein